LNFGVLHDLREFDLEAFSHVDFFNFFSTKQTVGGQDLVFWPRVPKDSSVVEYASAEQGTKRGDAAIAWKFQTIDKTTKVYVRILVPPSSKATLQLDAAARKVTITTAKTMPDLSLAREKAKTTCQIRRKSSQHGFPFFYHYDRFKEEWTKVNQAHVTGTSCTSFLWEIEDKSLEWLSYAWNPDDHRMPKQVLQPGLFQVVIDDWPLGPPAPLHTYDNFNISKIGPYCHDVSQFNWEMDDAVHLV
jgi:hypothetical protein